MTATLRTVLEQPLQERGSDLAAASVHLTRALVDVAPVGCDVAAFVPAADESAAELIPGLREVRVAPLQRRELLAAWQLGVGPNAGGALVHSPTIAAPLVRHDRSNSGEQVVVTMWDLRAWEASTEMHRAAVAWNRGMLKRVLRHADAVVVPSFAHAARLDEEWHLGDRIRVIAGAAPTDFLVPSDVIARRRDLALPDSYVAIAGEIAPSDGFGTAARAARAAVDSGHDVVVFQTAVDDEDAVRAAALAAGIPEHALHIRPVLDSADRAVVVAEARALVAGTSRTQWPWRVVEAFAVGTPVVGVDTPVLREIIADAGTVATADELPAAVTTMLERDEAIARVMAADRGRTFSWNGAAERVWQLHAEL